MKAARVFDLMTLHALKTVAFIPLLNSSECVSVCVLLLEFSNFSLRHGGGQLLRSGEVLRSQSPSDKALFSSVQKQISGLSCWYQVYVSAPPTASPATPVHAIPSVQNRNSLHSHLFIISFVLVVVRQNYRLCRLFCVLGQYMWHVGISSCS